MLWHLLKILLVLKDVIEKRLGSNTLEPLHHFLSIAPLSLEHCLVQNGSTPTKAATGKGKHRGGVGGGRVSGRNPKVVTVISAHIPFART